MPLTFDQIVLERGQNLLLKNIGWQQFKTLLGELGESRATRLSYSHGILEIMSPLTVHEFSKRILGDFVEALLEEQEIEYWPLGSTTFENEKMEQAVEPDECFFIQNEAKVRGKKRIDLTRDPPPDLVIEIDITSHTRLKNYERLGVPEFWKFDGEKLEIYLYKEGHYISSENSSIFPNI